MPPKTCCHRCGTKLRGCHPMYRSCIGNDVGEWRGRSVGAAAAGGPRADRVSHLPRRLHRPAHPALLHPHLLCRLPPQLPRCRGVGSAVDVVPRVSDEVHAAARRHRRPPGQLHRHPAARHPQPDQQHAGTGSGRRRGWRSGSRSGGCSRR